MGLPFDFWSFIYYLLIFDHLMYYLSLSLEFVFVLVCISVSMSIHIGIVISILVLLASRNKSQQCLFFTSKSSRDNALSVSTRPTTYLISLHPWRIFCSCNKDFLTTPTTYLISLHPNLLVIMLWRTRTSNAKVLK